jgi:RNA polymerase sigma factor (TIGR02999 family)
MSAGDMDQIHAPATAPVAGDITRLLLAAHGGDPLALGAVFEQLYPELRRIARARMRRTNERVVLDTTALVHECYLRLLKVERLHADDRGHFLAYAASAMRSVVVDIAREQLAHRRGGGLAFVTFDTQADIGATGEAEVLRVHEALQDLAFLDDRLVRVVEMRYFVGLEHSEIAQALGVSCRTVDRYWERARSFLFDALRAG